MSEREQTIDGVAVVTGGAHGIGLAIAAELASRGAQVVIADSNSESARAAAAELSRSGQRVEAVHCDVRSESSVERAFAEVAERFARVRILVNNAGVSIDQGVRRLTKEAWDQTIATNLTGVMLCSRAVSAEMIAAKDGRIVNISSRAWLGWSGQLSYAASKGGVVSATRSLAIEVAKHGVTVNCVAPGLIETRMLGNVSPEVLEGLMRAQPDGTLGQPEDVAWAVAFFSSAEASMITGQVLYVCGGKSLFARQA